MAESSENPPPEVRESDGQSSNAHFKGVRMRKWGKWVAEVRLPNSRKRIWLGSYDTPEKAARAYDAAVYCLRGPTATFNFPETPPDIPSARILSAPEIRLAAARFAHAEPAQTPASEVGSTEEEDAAAKADGGGGTTMEAMLKGSGEGSSNLGYFDSAFGEEYYIPAEAAEAAQEEEDGGEFYEVAERLWDF